MSHSIGQRRIESSRAGPPNQAGIILNIAVHKTKLRASRLRRMKLLGGVFNDRVTEPELFCERPNNSLPLQGGAPIGRRSTLPRWAFCTLTRNSHTMRDGAFRLRHGYAHRNLRTDAIWREPLCVLIVRLIVALHLNPGF
jgi:hypothetical protein